MKVQQLPSLNGWRAVSILLVLGYHTAMMTGFPSKYARLFLTVFDGNLGVRFFFIISGFLITWLMLKEENKFNTVSLGNFYIRRTLRIWPVYLSFVALLGILQMLGIVIQHGYAWRGLLTFTRNFYDARNESLGDDVSQHCWSLSIEEQFYVFWPLTFRLLGKRARIWFLILLILFSAGFKTIYLLGFYDRHSFLLFQNYSTFNYVDCLSWGCLAAILLAAWRATLEELFKKQNPIVFAVSFSMILIPHLIGLGKGLQSAGFAILLLHSVVSPGWMSYRILNLKWMNRIGILSYSIYIWQQIIWLLWPKSLGAVWFLWLPLIFGISWISYEFLEKPFFTLRAKFRDARQPAP
jgi:peptidoglycan/LPS O-acetylase OafA/YrhL